MTDLDGREPPTSWREDPISVAAQEAAWLDVLDAEHDAHRKLHAFGDAAFAAGVASARAGVREDSARLAKALHFVLDNGDFADEGPVGEGWRSREMEKACGILEARVAALDAAMQEAPDNG